LIVGIVAMIIGTLAALAAVVVVPEVRNFIGL